MTVAIMIITRICRDRSANIILGIVGKITTTGRSAKVVDLEGWRETGRWGNSRRMQGAKEKG